MSDTAATPKRIEPPESEAAKPFWDASRDEKLVLQWCNPCNEIIWYPRAVCPSCLTDEGLEWRPAAGTGEVHTFSVIHKQANPFMQPPYTVALVALDEGARLMTNIVNCDPESVAVGMRVQIAWEPLSDGRRLPLFEPAVGG